MLAGASAATVLAVVLAACGSSGSTATEHRSAGPVSRPSASPTHAQRVIPPAKAIVEVPELRKTIAMTGCRASSGGWSGTGTAHNPTHKAQTYHLLVFFNDKFSRTIDYARTTVHVRPGHTDRWTATAHFDAPAGTRCVLRGLYEG